MLNLVSLGPINNKKNYLFAYQKGSWFEASYFCNAHGMDLVTIETQQENELIKGQIVYLGMEVCRFWTSGHKIGRSTYLWANGEYMIFSDWASGQPDFPVTEHCMTVHKSAWHDTNCTWVEDVSNGEMTAFICEEREPVTIGETEIEATVDIQEQNYYPADKLELISLGTPGTKYLFANQKASWMEASYFCNAHGMDLVTLETQHENELIMDHISSLGFTNNCHFWTGGHKIGRSTYLWINCEYMLFSDWAVGDPANPTTDHCIMLWNDNWYDHPCNLEVASGGYESLFICEERKVSSKRVGAEGKNKTAYYPSGTLNLISLGPNNAKKNYVFFKQAMTWMEASYFCNAYGMDLVIIESQQENDDINNHLVDIGLETVYMLSSGHKIGRSTYLWVNGDFMSFTDWASGQPANLASENCMAFYNGGWHDVLCQDKTAAFACEERSIS